MKRFELLIYIGRQFIQRWRRQNYFIAIRKFFLTFSKSVINILVSKLVQTNELQCFIAFSREKMRKAYFWHVFGIPLRKYSKASCLQEMLIYLTLLYDIATYGCLSYARFLVGSVVSNGLRLCHQFIDLILHK